jgi:hypothetical protein
MYLNIRHALINVIVGANVVTGCQPIVETTGSNLHGSRATETAKRGY